MTLFNKLLASAFVFSLFLLTSKHLHAMPICDSSFSLPEYDFVVEDPDQSHSIFSETRWRCVTAENGGDFSVTHSEYTSFDSALNDCSAKALQADYFEPNTDFHALTDAIVDVYAATGTVDEYVYTEQACIQLDDGPTEDESIEVYDGPKTYVGSFTLDLFPMDQFYYTAAAEDLSGEILEVKEADFGGWLITDRFLWLEYTAPIEISRCFDPLCEAGLTGDAQFIETPIEAAHGTVDVNLPIMSSDFPGLLPLSLHYSSWSLVSKTKDRNLDEIGQKLAENSPEDSAGIYWYHSWHHSYEKKLKIDFNSSDSSTVDEANRLFLYLPSEDTLIFEKSGEGNWQCISHPGVRATITQLDDSEYEVVRPDGYLERYDMGNLTFIQYPDGRELTFRYFLDEVFLTPALEISQNYPPVGVVIVEDLSGNIQQIRSTNEESYAFSFEYLEDDDVFRRRHLTAIQRPDGSRLTFDQTPIDLGINKLYLLNSVSLAGSELMRFSYDDKGRGTALAYLTGEQFEQLYSGENTTQVTGPYGAAYTLSSTDQAIDSSDFFGDLTLPSLTQLSCTNCGYSKSFSYGSDGQLSNLARSGNLPYSATLSLEGLMTNLTFDGSQSHNYTWDTTNRLLTDISGTDILSTSVSYDNSQVSGLTSTSDSGSRTIDALRSNGDVTSLSGVNQDRLTIDYTAEGFISSIKNSLDHQTQYQQFNHLGQPQQIIDANGVTTNLAYDPLGRILSYQSDDGENLTVEYDELGQAISGSYNGGSATLAYDTNQRLTQLSSTCGTSWDYTYLANGLLASARESHNGVGETTSYTYDVEGNRVSETTGVRVTQYNTRGQAISETDGNNLTQYTYDSNANLSNITTNSNQTASFVIGQYGRVNSVIAPGGRETALTYTGLGQLARQENSNWGFREYGYSAEGTLTSRNTPNFTNQLSYDNTDRRQSLFQSRVDSSTPDITVNYGYDDPSVVNTLKNYGIGHLTSVDNGEVSYQYRYDMAGNLNSQSIAYTSIPLSQSSIDYGYNQSAQMTEVKYPDGSILTYQRAACSGEVVSMSWNGETLVDLVHASQLNPFSQATLNNGLKIERTFDNRKRLTRAKLLETATNKPLLANIYQFNRQTNNLDSIVTATQVNSIITYQYEQFAYDGDNRLITAVKDSYGTLEYAYDEHSHRTSMTVTDNSLVIGQPAQSILTNLEYQNGKDSLTKLTDADNIVIKSYSFDADGYRLTGGDWGYQYDAAGRLSVVTQNGNWVASYTYDANGKRNSKTTADGTLYFYYDINGRLLEESLSDGTLVRQYIYTELGELIAFVTQDSQIYFTHNDHLGSTLFLIDSSGAPVWSADRQPFGETTVSGTIEFPFRLPGQYFDQETGLHYNQQRYYDPETGQYLRPDPFGVKGGYHTYNYAQQNPLIYVDPEGELFFLIPAIPYIVGAISAALTAYEVYDTVDGLASGRITKEDLAAGYLQDKAIQIGVKAIPFVGVGAALIYKATKKSKVDDIAKGPNSLFHYTDDVGLDGILTSKKLNPSLKANNPKDARFGDGQYLSDTLPSTRTNAELSHDFIGIPFQGKKFKNYIEVDVTGLNVTKGRDGVFVVPNGSPLDISNRIIRSGSN